MKLKLESEAEIIKEIAKIKDEARDLLSTCIAELEDNVHSLRDLRCLLDEIGNTIP